MKKVADFNTFKRLKSMSFNDFNRWAVAFYQAAYEDGKEAGKQETEDRFNNEAELYTFEELYDLLVSIKGISPRLASEAMDRIVPDVEEETEDEE